MGGLKIGSLLDFRDIIVYCTGDNVGKRLRLLLLKTEP
jgi:hypothetical protein